MSLPDRQGAPGDFQAISKVINITTHEVRLYKALLSHLLCILMVYKGPWKGCNVFSSYSLHPGNILSILMVPMGAWKGCLAFSSYSFNPGNILSILMVHMGA